MENGEQGNGDADDSNDGVTEEGNQTDGDERCLGKTGDCVVTPSTADVSVSNLESSVAASTEESADDVGKVNQGEADDSLLAGSDVSVVSSEDDDYDTPDGGWGWLVLVGCFIVNFISDGCSYSFGVLYTELLAYFGETKSKTSWVGSLFFSVPLLCGPIASIITTKIGCRKATIVGGVIAMVGFLSSSFVQSVESLYFTYGIVAGFGMSLPYLTSILVLSFYFKKRLAFATGVAECGAGIGTIVFAPLTESLLSAYAWRGAMYIIAAIAGHIIVSGALFRPVRMKNRTITVVVDNDTGDGQCEECKQEDKCVVECSNDCHCKLIDDECILPNTDHTGSMLDTLCNGYKQPKTVHIDEVDKSQDHDRTRIKYVPNGANSLLPSDHICKRSATYNTSLSSSTHICGGTCHKHWRGFHDSMKLSIFHHPIFILFITSNFILYFWFDVPFVFLANRAVERGMGESQAALLVSVIGVLHTLGNLLFGIVGDRENVSLPLLYGVSIAVCGASLLVVPSFDTFLPLAFVAGVFGLFSAASEALSSILLIDILGEGYLSQSYGFTMFLKGVANLVGPPVAGWLFDDSGSYDNTFYAAGTCLIIAGLMYLPTPVLRRSNCSRSRCAAIQSHI